MTSISQRATGVRDMPVKEIAEHQGRHRLVSDDEVGDALRWLATNAREIGEARAKMIKRERFLQHTEALLTKMSDASSDAKKRVEARADERWLEAANAEADAAGAFETMKALREAAAARIEAWRTESASLRRT